MKKMILTAIAVVSAAFVTTTFIGFANAIVFAPGTILDDQCGENINKVKTDVNTACFSSTHLADGTKMEFVTFYETNNSSGVPTSVVYTIVKRDSLPTPLMSTVTSDRLTLQRVVPATGNSYPYVDTLELTVSFDYSVDPYLATSLVGKVYDGTTLHFTSFEYIFHIETTAN